MNTDDFKSAMEAFTDDQGDIDLTRGQLVVQIRDELITANVTVSDGDVFVEENGTNQRAFDWLIKRVAKVPQLASRIATHVLAEPHFVAPAGKVLHRLADDATDDESHVSDVPDEVTRLLSDKPAATSTVLYVTSDAGEGKTTVIDHVARRQAQAYQNGKANWLLVPLRLGGRSFLTFEDVIVAELVNRFRFQFFYYDAFIELVRLGVLIPAFDGFEEVFVEGSPGEAVSSLGNFVRSLDSSGSVVIAVRKAHFEYQNFQDQARLLDATADVDVAFAQISLARWDRQRFLTYARRRGLSSSDPVYDTVSKRLGEGHPLLTRAVLAKRLVDVAEGGDVAGLVERLGTDVADYFFHFVNAIVEREVLEKWIDRSGTPHQPLLTVEEHHILLTMISKEMWIASSDEIDGDYLDLIAELFAEEFGKSSPIARQISNRIRQHSLMAINRTKRPVFSFDHSDFKVFYWGEALARMLLTGGVGELQTYLGRRSLPAVSADAAVAAMGRAGTKLTSVLRSLVGLAKQGPTTSYVGENVGVLAIRIAAGKDSGGLTLDGVYFRPESLKGRRLRNLNFVDCDFAASSLEKSEFVDVTFKGCRFDQLDLVGSFTAVRARLEQCSVSCVVWPPEGHIYEPERIAGVLIRAGFELDVAVADFVVSDPGVQDERTDVAARALRTFLRATTVNQTTLERRLGAKSKIFFKDVLPPMLEHGILKEVEYKGRGQRQGRFKLGVGMSRVAEGLADRIRSPLPEFLSGLAGDG